MKTNIFPNWTKTGLVVLLPLALYSISALPLLEWIIDDAGISYAYARSFASGAGLVSQPGMIPVEGYSNFLWVLLLSATIKLGIFDPYYLPKAISLVLVGLTLVFTLKSIRLVSGSSYLLPLCALLFISTNASFVIWTTSGLENALYVALISFGLVLMLKNASEKIPSIAEAAKIGAVIGLAALTRPDGAIYILSLPLIVLSLHRPTDKTKPIEAVKSISGFVGAFALTYGSYVVFRLVYFGALHPNTYYAKGGLKPSIRNLHSLMNSFLGGDLWIPISLVLIGALIHANRRRSTGWRRRAILWNMAFLATLAYMLLPGDWMGEFRFATPFFALMISAIVVEAQCLVNYLTSIFKSARPNRSLLISIMLLSLFGMHFAEHNRRLKSFSKNSTVSFEGIAIRFGHTFNTYADVLNLNDASLLTPDLGGTLYYSKLRIYDLMGLCDGVIAHLHPKSQPAFYDYVFDDIKPTFIHTHGFFTAVSLFDTDERFARDYVGIFTQKDEFATKQLGREIESGDYIRRDALPDGEKSLELLRAQ